MESLLFESKKRILEKLLRYSFYIGFLLFALTLYFLYEYYAYPERRSEDSNTLIISAGVIFMFILIGISLLLHKKNPKIFMWVFPSLFIVWFFIDPLFAATAVSIPIILSSLLISPQTGFIFAGVFATEITFSPFYLSLPYPFLSSLTNAVIPFYILFLFFSVIGHMISKELHETFEVLEKQNLELSEIRKQLTQKVENQSQEIEEKKKETEDLSSKLKEMRLSLNRLKSKN